MNDTKIHEFNRLSAFFFCFVELWYILYRVQNNIVQYNIIQYNTVQYNSKNIR